MKRLFIIAVATGTLASSAVSQAQVMSSAESKPGGPGDLTIAAFDPSDAVSPLSVVEGPGVKIGEGTVLHPVFGIETGFVSNVFYTETNEQPAGILRLVGQIGTASVNTNPARMSSDISESDETEDLTITEGGKFEYSATARLSYDQMLAGDEVVRDTGGLGIGAFFQGLVNPHGSVSFGMDENFVRLIRAANYETSSNDNRDINNLRLTLLLHPPGRRLSGYLYYKNVFDVFEGDNQLYPNRLENRLGVHPMWKWLPETTVFADISQGVVTGIGNDTGSQMKVTSYPLVAMAGITTLLSLKTAFIVAAGYTNGFYSNGPSFSGPTVSSLFTWRYSPKAKLGISYDLLYSDSVNANYYRDHVIRLFVQQALDPVVLMIQPEVHFREYSGVTVPSADPTRDDTIFAVRGGVHYSFRNWIAAVLDYKFSTIQTDFRYVDGTGMTVDPSYVRHELMLGVRAAM